jgi:hypothetical protein
MENNLKYMDWIAFEKNIRNWTSQTYDIVVDNMDLSDWDKFIALIENKNYIQSFATPHSEPQKSVDKVYLWDYFKNSSEFWPSITLKIDDLQLESHIKSKNELEIWFNDNDQSAQGLNKTKYARLIDFMIEISKQLDKEVSFMHEDAIDRYLIFKIDKAGLMKEK